MKRINYIVEIFKSLPSLIKKKKSDVCYYNEINFLYCFIHLALRLDNICGTKGRGGSEERDGEKENWCVSFSNLSTIEMICFV